MTDGNALSRAHIWCCALVAIVVIALVTPVTATTNNWSDGTSDWNNSANWTNAFNSSIHVVPAANDTVNIVNTDGTGRTITYNTNSPGLGILSIDLIGAGSAFHTLSMPNNNSLIAGGLLVGGYNGSAQTNGRGAVTQSAGSTTVSSGFDLVLGHGSGSTGNYSLSGGSLTANQSEYIGLAGTGTFTHTAGTNTINAGAIGSFDIGVFSTANGTYHLSGTGLLLSSKSEYIGDMGVGNFNQNGGTNTIAGAANNLYLGYSATGLGTYTLDSGSLSIAGSEYVGFSATGNVSQAGGRFIQTSGSHFISGTLSIGTNSGAKGSFTISNSGSLVAGNAVIGAAGTGMMTIQDQASVHISNDLNIGSLGSVNFSGGILRFDTVTGTSLSRLIYTGGAIKLAGQRSIGSDSTISTLFSASPTIPTGKGLTIEGSARILTNVAVNGGRFIGLADVEVGHVGGSPITVAISNGGYAHSESELAVGSGDVATAAGIVTVDGAGSLLETYGNVSLGHAAAGTLQLTGGASATTGGSAVIGSTNGAGSATVGGPGSTWNITGNLSLTGSGTGVGVLNIQNQGVVSVGGALTIDANNSVDLSGGKLRLNTVTGTSLDRLTYSSGTVQLSGDRDLNSDQIVQKLFGMAPTIPAGKALTVEGAATLTGPLTLNGGSLSALQLLGPQNVQVQHGLLDVQNQAATFAQGGVVDLAADATINYGLGITNHGLVMGDGQLGGPFTNSLLGEVRAVAGKSLTFTGGGNTSSGLIQLQGGTLQFEHDLTVSGTLIADTGTLDVEQLVLLTLSEMKADHDAEIKAAVAKMKGHMAVKGKLKLVSPNKVELSGLTDVDHGTVEALGGLRFGTDEMENAANDMKSAMAAQQNGYRQQQEDLANLVEQLRQSNQIGDDTQLANIGLQNHLQQVQQVMQLATNVVHQLHCDDCPSVVANLKSTINADTDFLGKLVAGGTAGLSTVDVNGDLTFAPDSHLELDLAGTADGQFDKVAVSGNVSIDIGTTIKLSLLDPSNPQSGTNLFQPQVGDYFDVLTANTIDAGLILVEPPPQSLLNYVTGVFNSGGGQLLRITAAPVPVALPGDFNNDGKVDAADYVVWRNNNGTHAVLLNDSSPGLVNATDYNNWRAHFGQTSGSGAFLARVPEPASYLFELFLMLPLLRRHWRF